MTETIQIGGMSCGGCVNSVKRALERLPLRRAEVGKAVVDYDKASVTREQLVTAIEEAGFKVTLH